MQHADNTHVTTADPSKEPTIERQPWEKPQYERQSLNAALSGGITNSDGHSSLSS